MRAQEEKSSVEGEAEARINEKKKCILPVSRADENRRDKVQSRLLHRAAMYKMHTSVEKNGKSTVDVNQCISDHVLNTVFICRRTRLCIHIKSRCKIRHIFFSTKSPC